MARKKIEKSIGVIRQQENKQITKNGMRKKSTHTHTHTHNIITTNHITYSTNS